MKLAKLSEKMRKMRVKTSKSRCACGLRCPPPIRFHEEAKGQHITLSAGRRRARRVPSSFQHGLTFTDRPLKLQEKLCVLVERSVAAWHGALRVGFTSIQPGFVPLPPLAIPDLTDTPGYWAVLVPERHCPPRSHLCFWLDRHGFLHVQTSDGGRYSVKTKADTRKPVWAMIDVYGQTTSVLLLGTEKKGKFYSSSPCNSPTDESIKENCGYDSIPMELLKRLMDQTSLEMKNQILPSLSQSREQNTSNEGKAECVVCLSECAALTLPCGHMCMCGHCASRVFSEFGTCPLCRQSILPAV